MMDHAHKIVANLCLRTKILVNVRIVMTLFVLNAPQIPWLDALNALMAISLKMVVKNAKVNVLPVQGIKIANANPVNHQISYSTATLV